MRLDPRKAPGAGGGGGGGGRGRGQGGDVHFANPGPAPLLKVANPDPGAGASNMPRSYLYRPGESQIQPTRAPYINLVKEDQRIPTQARRDFSFGSRDSEGFAQAPSRAAATGRDAAQRGVEGVGLEAGGLKVKGAGVRGADPAVLWEMPGVASAMTAQPEDQEKKEHSVDEEFSDAESSLVSDQLSLLRRLEGPNVNRTAYQGMTLAEMGFDSR